jgi:cyclomaltodextrinase / maltogenic alpha-amylase / neopullulanase
MKHIVVFCLLTFWLNIFAQTTPSVQDVYGLITPIQLVGEKTEVNLEDYFMDVNRIKNVFVGQGLSVFLAADKKTYAIKNSNSTPLLSNMFVILNDGKKYDFLIKNTQKKPISFKLTDKGYKNVALKGDFNAWNANEGIMKKKGNTWEITINANPGSYEYMFAADGTEIKDPLSIKASPNGQHSLLDISKPDSKKLVHLYTFNQKVNSINIGYDTLPTQAYFYWQNTRIPHSVNKSSKTLNIMIPDNAKSIKRSFMRGYAYNTEGVSNDILIPLEYGKIIQNVSEINRFDKEAQIMYFVLVDRFKNGKKTNDNPDKNPLIHPMANWQGGDLEGITQKINDGYLKSLNINSLWVSPITKNPDSAYQEYPAPQRWYTGYHGYWPTVSSMIDPHFGTDTDMKNMVQSAHEKGINVLLDYVCHHVHVEHPIYKSHPDWITKLDLPNGKKNIRIWDDERLTTWFDTFIPTLNLTKPEVIKMNTDSTMYWLTNYDLDGFRHDAAKHIGLPFWRNLTKKLKTDVIAKNKNVYQIGETYGSRELIQSYINTGMMDAQFDFSVYFDSREVIGKEGVPFSIVENTIRESFNYFGHHSTMGYMTGNHDQPRFISLAGGSLKWNENDREAGFARKIEVGDPIGYKRLQMMTALMFSMPGVPVIFYGDEIGLPGAGDPDCRRMMRFEGEWTENEKENKQIVEKITALRANRLSMIYGDTEILKVSDDQFVMMREYFGEISVSIFNKSKNAVDISFELPKRYTNTNLKSNFQGKITKNGAKVTVNMPATTFDILTN